MKRLKTILVDDAPLIRFELKKMLEDFPNIQVIGEAASVKEAISLINALKPDVVFLDIHLPGSSGFDLLDSINGDFKVIFISSFYDRYSVKAQKYNPIDFLTKPINKSKLAAATLKLDKQASSS